MTALDILVTALRADGYKVSTNQKNTITKKELIISIDSVELEVETSVSYFLTYRLNIVFIEEDISSIISEIENIINVSESATYSSVRTTVFESPQIENTEGTLYKISIPFTYKDIITIGG